MHHLLVFVFLLVPAITSAQYFGEIDTFFGRVVGFINNVLVPLVFTLALFVFIYGMFNFFILNGENEGDRESGRDLMVSAVIGFVLMVSIWGIVNLVASGLFGTTTTPPPLPGIPTL